MVKKQGICFQPEVQEILPEGKYSYEVNKRLLRYQMIMDAADGDTYTSMYYNKAREIYKRTMTPHKPGSKFPDVVDSINRFYDAMKEAKLMCQDTRVTELAETIAIVEYLESCE